MAIADFLACRTSRPSKANFNTDQKRVPSVIRGIVLVNRSVAITWGSTDYKPSTVVAKLYALALAGDAFFFPFKTLTEDSKKDSTEERDDTKFFTGDTGEVLTVTETFDIGYKFAPYDVPWFNWLRAHGSGKFHAFVFGDNYVLPIIDRDLVFSDIAPFIIEGDSKKRTRGRFKFAVTIDAEGENGSLVPYFGQSYLTALNTFPKLTLAGPALSSGVTAATCVGEVPRLLTAAAGTSRTLTFSITEVGVQCVTWELYKNCNEPADAAFTINQSGVVALSNTLTASLHKYRVVAYNPAGVAGFMDFEVLVSA